MNMMQHAKEEFKILNEHVPDAIIRYFEKEILVLVDAVAKSGQSGGSAPYTASAVAAAVKDLCMHKPLFGILGVDSEWSDITAHMDGKETYQNTRLSSVFKEGKDGVPHYLEAIIFKNQFGNTYTTSKIELEDGTSIGSSQNIKSFPFKPKTFYIDVIDTEWSDETETLEEQGGGWWTSVIKDEKQLEEVFEYYNKYAKYE